MKHAQKRSRNTRDLVLETAGRLFSEQGYSSVSTEQIALAAGISKGSVFAHFGDKSNLLAAVCCDELTILIAHIEGIRASLNNQSLPTRILAVYKPWLAFFLDNPEFARLYIGQPMTPDGTWSQQFNSMCIDFEKLLYSELQTAELSLAEDRLEFIINGLQAFFFQVVTYRLAGWIDSKKAAEEELANYVKVWLSADFG